MVYKAVDIDGFCNKNRESINVFIDNKLINLVYVYPSSFCREQDKLLSKLSTSSFGYFAGEKLEKYIDPKFNTYGDRFKTKS